MSTVSFKNVNKIYDNNVQAVFDFTLDVNDKEFIVLVGPSGCGKSTTLRMLAGLEEITDGTISIDDKIINNVHPKDRDIAMVFQNYALYPHMTVFDNMAFSLKLRKIPEPVLDVNGQPILEVDKKRIAELEADIKSYHEETEADLIAAAKEEIERLKANPSAPMVKWRKYSKKEIVEKVNAASDILGLGPYLDRKPAALSGGQRQRVALGRAIVRTPKVFLMDEPLSNLDAKLRVQMRSEIIKIHQKVNATTVYVTHDQTEAMTMASRIVIMKDGYIQQIGSPKEVYNNPSNMFVAGFIGSPATNFFKCTLLKDKLVINSEEEGKEIPIDIDKKQLETIKSYLKEETEKANKLYKELDDDFYERRDLMAQGEQTSDPKQLEKIKAKLAEYEKLNYPWANAKKNAEYYNSLEFDKGVPVVLGIRPEDIHLEKSESNKDPSVPFELVTDICELLGHELIVYSYLNGQRIIIKIGAFTEIEKDQKIKVCFDKSKIHFFDAESTKRII